MHGGCIGTVDRASDNESRYQSPPQIRGPNTLINHLRSASRRQLILVSRVSRGLAGAFAFPTRQKGFMFRKHLQLIPVELL
jgi:hypothetical protein